MRNLILFVIYMITILSIATASSADSHSSTNQKENAANHQNQQIITIQVSSHKKAEDANREKNRLKSHGLDVFVDYESVKGKGMWHRVYIGQFESREAANTFAQDLVEQGILTGYWVKKKASLKTVDTEKERQGAPVETNAKINTFDEQISVTPTEASSPPIQSTITKEVGSQQSVSEETQPPDTENKVTEETDVKETPATAQVNSDIPQQNQSRISLGIKSSVLASNKTGDFEVTNSGSGSTESWSFGNAFIWFGVVGNYRLNDMFTIESSLEKDLMKNIDNWLLSFAVKYQLRPIGRFTPYFKGGGIIGRLNRDGMPGDFDTGLGLEGGLGMHLTKSGFRLGLEASYRYMKYNYNPPGADNITSTDDNLNMSGLVLSGTLSYLF